MLITEEDCGPQDFDLSALRVERTTALSSSHLHSPTGVPPLVVQFMAAALADTPARLGTPDAPVFSATDPAHLIAPAIGATEIVTPHGSTGPLRDWPMAVTPRLAAAGATLTEWRRPRDDMIWPDCLAGVFQVKERISHYLQASGVWSPMETLP